jgi:CRISPR/Cas system-associated exonuclease Cas4 (RecB family)
MKLRYGPYSPSRLDTGICGYSFCKQYIDPNRVKEASSLPQARGSAIHEVFELITRKICSEPDAVFSDTEIRTWVADAILRNPRAQEETDAALEMARLYVRRPPPLLTKDAGIEMRLAIKLTGFDENQQPIFEECSYDSDEAFARGRADILMISDDTTTAIIYDHKTQPNVEEADTFQLGFYAWVVSKFYPFLETIKTVLHFARYGSYSEPYVWTKEDLKKIEDEALTRVQIIEQRGADLTPVPNNKCQYCPFLSECPAWRDFVMVDEQTGKIITKKRTDLRIMNNTQKAVEVAGLVSVLEEIVGLCKEELREHVKQFGPIAIPGKVFEYRGTEQINWDLVNKNLKKTAAAVFTKHGVDPMDHMGFSQTFSSSVWMLDKPELVKELSKIFPRKVKTEFRGYKG